MEMEMSSVLQRTLLAGCQRLLRLLVLEILMGTYVCSPTKQTNCLVVDRVLVGGHSGSGWEAEVNGTPDLPPRLN